MIWAGSTVRLQWGYVPKTKPSIKWDHLSNGNWAAIDRGFAQDKYDSDITFIGPRSELETLESVLDSNRGSFTASFGTGEEVFGMDLDYSSPYSITVTKYGDIAQQDFDKWVLPMSIRLISPTLKSTAGSLSGLRMASFNSIQNSEFDIIKVFTPTNMLNVWDSQIDSGIFEAEFMQTSAEMEIIRRYLLNTNRTGTFTFPSFPSADTPFGFREGTGPFNTRIIDWTETGRANYTDWGIKIIFAREF